MGLLIANYVVCCAALHHVRWCVGMQHWKCNEENLSCKSNCQGVENLSLSSTAIQSVNIEISDFCYSDLIKAMPACVTGKIS